MLNKDGQRELAYIVAIDEIKPIELKPLNVLPETSLSISTKVG